MGTQQQVGDPNTTTIDLNVGGVFYTTSLATLTKEAESSLASMFTREARGAAKDSKGKFFIDRDGVLFRYILDYLRNGKIILPENFHERERLRAEAEHFQLPGMIKTIHQAAQRHSASQVLSMNFEPNEAADADNALDNSMGGPISTIDLDVSRSGTITVGYRGTFAFGRDGLADIKFRKLTRILVAGRVSLCREVFGDTLNESRDPDRGGLLDRYTSRYFLKHNFLEQAMDMLLEAGFRCMGSCASGTSGAPSTDAKAQDTEEGRWNHYNEFIFVRAP